MHMRKILCLVVAIVAMACPSWAQRTVSGKVTDDKELPVPNVSIQVKGTQTGTVSNSDGTYSLTVPSNARALIFSSVGMATLEVVIGNRVAIDIKLQNATEANLQEVVVVGYGTQRRKEITGNVAQISGSKLKDQPIQTFEQGLSGRAAGVNVSIPNGVLGNPPIIRVRGTNSISLSSSPLIVIDGIPSFSGDAGGTASNNLLGDINPSDIESVEVLKDASASAIYGSRASAGVVLITTKRGRQGRTRVNYDGWAGWTKPYHLIDVLNAQEFTNLKNEALVNAGTAPNGTVNADGTVSGPATNARGFYTMNDANGNLVDTRWYDYIYRTGFAQNHTISVSGANDRTSYYFSGGYTDQAGMFINNNFRRMTGRFTLDHKVTGAITIGGTFNYTSNHNTGVNTGSTGAAFNTSGSARLAFALAPNVGPYKKDGTYNINGATIGQGNNLTTLAFTNPVMLNNLNRFESNGERVLGNIYGQVRLFQGLTFKTVYGLDHYSVVNEEFRNAAHGDGSQFNGATQNTLQRPHRWDWQNILTYDTRFADHGLNVLVGAEQTYTLTNNWGADRRNQTDPFFDEYQGSYIDIVPAGNTYAESFLQSYFGRVNYDFQRKYFLSLNARRDGYSAFAKKWGTFYGGSAGWSISEEGFWKSASFSNALSLFRLRGSYGMVGNFAGIGSYPYQTLFTGGLYGSSGAIFFNQAGNPNLTWEKSKKLDVGFNLGLFNDRFTVDFAYYKNDISDLVLAEPQSPSRGIPGSSILRNVGSMVNKGVEVTLNGTILRGKDFSWNSNFNITTLKNEVTALSNNNADILVSTGGLESPSLIRVGESIGSFLAVKTTGINPDNGRRVFLMKDGTPVQYNHAASTATRWTRVSDGTAISTPPNQVTDGVLIGPALPKFFGGFDNTFRYKGFDLNILLYFSGGNYVYNGSKAGLHDNRNWNSAKDALNRWLKPGDVVEWPKVVFGDNISNGSGLVISSNVEKGDFIKGRNVSLGYTLPQTLVSRMKLTNVRVYAAALNAFTITNYSGFDPETQSNGESVANQVTNGAPGVDRNSAPLARTINVGINIGF